MVIIYTVKTALIDVFSENNNFQKFPGDLLKIVIFCKCINPCCFYSVNDDHPDFENLNIFEGGDFLKILKIVFFWKSETMLFLHCK
jgi:hypothetical protein